MKVTLICPAMGKRAEGPGVGTWKMGPLALAVLAGLTPPEWEVRAVDDRLEAIPYDEPTDPVGISIEAFTARRGFYLTYMDRGALRRHRLLYLLPIPVSFVVAYRLHDHSPELFWTLLAYVAIYHFIQQQWGFIALYKARARERRSFDYYQDRWTPRCGSSTAPTT